MFIDIANRNAVEITAASCAIFANMVLTETEFQHFRKHGKKLRQRAKSLEKWHNSAYGQIIRFCDSESLNSVSEVWESYAKEEVSNMSRFDVIVKGAKCVGEAKGISRELLVASAPCIYGPVADLDGLREKYWKFGSLQDDDGRYWNPTFGGIVACNVLHPSTCPLEGFHLSLALDIGVQMSPLAVPKQFRDSSHPDYQDPYLTATVTQFSSWGMTFNKACQEGRITLRFAVADALAFCEALQKLNPETPRNTSDWTPRNQLKLKNMDLNSPDYVPRRASQTKNPPRSDQRISESEGTALEEEDQGQRRKTKAPKPDRKAPVRFNAIDTGSLTDKCGSMNILLATAPLLDRSPSSTLVTSASFKEHPDQEGVLIGFFPGDFETIALLLGLMPIEYWCNSTPTPIAPKNFSLLVQKVLGKNPVIRSRLCWKSCLENDYAIDGEGPLGDFYVPSNQLATLLHIFYANMFDQVEDEGASSKGTWHRQVKTLALSFHTRATFAALLKRVKHTVRTERDEFVKIFLGLFDEEQKSTGIGYFSELLAQLHCFGVLDFADLGPLLGQPFANATLVHVTVCVPRHIFDFLDGRNMTRSGRLRVVCSVWHSEKKTMDFGVLHMTFGTFIDSGQVFGRSSSRLVIVENKYGWLAKFSPLLVTFCAPSWVFAEPELKVAFRFEKDPLTVELFEPILGSSLTIFETDLDDEMGVFEAPGKGHDDVVSSGIPSPRRRNPVIPVLQRSLSGDTLVSASEQLHETTSTSNVLQDGHCPTPADSFFKELSSRQSQNGAPFRQKIFVTFDSKKGTILAMCALLSPTSEEWKTKLSNDAGVFAKQVSPCSVRVFVEGSSEDGDLVFPVPTKANGVMVKKVVEAGKIILTFRLGIPTEAQYFPQLTVPSFSAHGEFVPQGMQYLPLECLPILDRSKLRPLDGLERLVSHTFSRQERAYALQMDQCKIECYSDMRPSFKDSLAAVFQTAMGLEDRIMRGSFPFSDGKGGFHFILCVSAVRFDIVDQSVVLDAAIITVTPRNTTPAHMAFADLRSIKKDVPSYDGIYYIDVDEFEMGMWKKMLCGAVERAREWSHRDDCWYKISGFVPISLELNEDFLCSCGHGILPKDYLKNPPRDWDKLKETAVRAAISPFYASMLVEAQIPDPLLAECLGKDPENQCFTCAKKQELADKEMAKCSRCNFARYCSKECQREGWKRHKKVCQLYTAFANDDRARCVPLVE
ncbi:hypothetical protein IWX47DRAFT_944672 [Phyllosticta citricarpa]